MKYKVKEHEEMIKEFVVYQLAPNGEVCKRIASCRDENDANRIALLLEREYLSNASGH